MDELDHIELRSALARVDELVAATVDTPAVANALRYVLEAAAELTWITDVTQHWIAEGYLQRANVALVHAIQRVELMLAVARLHVRAEP